MDIFQSTFWKPWNAFYLKALRLVSYPPVPVTSGVCLRISQERFFYKTTQYKWKLWIDLIEYSPKFHLT